MSIHVDQDMLCKIQRGYQDTNIKKVKKQGYIPESRFAVEEGNVGNLPKSTKQGRSSSRIGSFGSNAPTQRQKVGKKKVPSEGLKVENLKYQNQQFISQNPSQPPPILFSFKPSKGERADHVREGRRLNQPKWDPSPYVMGLMSMGGEIAPLTHM